MLHTLTSTSDLKVRPHQARLTKTRTEGKSRDKCSAWTYSHEATVANDLCSPRYRKGQTMLLVPNGEGPKLGKEYLFLYRAAPPEVAGDAGIPVVGVLDCDAGDSWAISRWEGGPKVSLPKKLWYPTYRIVGLYCERLTKEDEFFADPQPRPKWASRKGAPVCHYEAKSNDMAPRWEKGDMVLVKHELPKELNDYVLLEMRSGALVVRLLEGMTEKTLTLTKHNPAETVTISRSEVKAMHRVIGLEEALYSGAL